MDQVSPGGQVPAKDKPHRLTIVQGRGTQNLIWDENTETWEDDQ